MPRAAGSGKRHQGSNGHRDSKHDNGLVGPAKRNSKKGHNHHQPLPEGSARSADKNGNSNVAANANASGTAALTNGHSHAHGQSASLGRRVLPSSDPAEPSPSISSTSSLPFHQTHPQNCPPSHPQYSSTSASAPSATRVHSNGTNHHHAADPSSLTGSASNNASFANDNTIRRSSLTDYSDTSSDFGAPNSNNNNNNMVGPDVVDGGHRQIDVNALKNSDVHKDSGFLDMATSILKSLPMQDTLAILILLMQIPSLSLSVVYTTFTFLTFVPPVTTSSGMNINLAEIFDGNSTMPSLVTIVCMDLVFLLTWLFFWPSLQDFILDCAKPVIAITLGGGNSPRNGASGGVMTCFSWVLIHHLFRRTKAHWSRLAAHVPEEWNVPSFVLDSLQPSPAIYDKKSTFGFVRSVLAIHILTQGVVRYIREWYIRREKVSASTGGTVADPEAAKPQNVTGESSHDAGGGGGGGGTSNMDNNEAGLQAAPPLGSKKRRKQVTQVRLQQPLWAALASTKIVVMKEYELSHAGSESVGSNATDIHNLGNAPFDRQSQQIWISFIGSDEVCFSTSYFPDHPQSSSSKPDEGQGTRPTGIDTAKPFYVRVNHAFWQPTRMFPVAMGADADNPPSSDPAQLQGGSRWSGDIYGLRPSSKYVCEFVDTCTDQIIFSTSIRTIHETRRENDSTAVTEGPQSLRPDSPTTTLRTSIAAAETKLSEEKTRLRGLRKDWKTRVNTLKRENESADNQLSTAGNQDEKHRQKIRQQETQKSQAERDAVTLTEQLKNFDTAPELADLKKKTDKSHGGEKKIFDVAQKQFKDHKVVLESEVKDKEVERSNLTTRRTKIVTRIAKVENELANITDANTRGLDEAERRRQARTTWMEQANMIEANVSERLGRTLGENAAMQDGINSHQAQLAAYQEVLANSTGMPFEVAASNSDPMPQHYSKGNGPWNTPAHHFTQQSMWTGSSGDLRQPQAASSSHWQATNTIPFEPRAHNRARGRTSSMLSDVSGFTQSSDEDDLDQTARQSIWHPGVNTGLEASSGSGTGTGSGSGTVSHSGSGSSGASSTGDPTSPT